MTPGLLSYLLGAVISTAIGMMIGLEREHRDVEVRAAAPTGTASTHGSGESLLGVRTFALLSLTGWLCGLLGVDHAWLPIVGLLVVGAIASVVILRVSDLGRGLTTEIAAVATFLIGLVCFHDRVLATALGLGTTLLLVSKPWFASWIPKLRRLDLLSTVQLAIVLAIVLPLLPTTARDPWHVLSPRKIGWFVALIAALGWVGYVLNRLYGHRRGAGLTGLVGGIASSTAVTASMAQHARKSEAMRVPGQLAVFLACAMLQVRVLVETMIVSREVARALAWPLMVMAAGIFAGVLWKWRASKSVAPEANAETDVKLENPFSLLPALKWGIYLAVVLVGSAVAQALLGPAGVLAAAGAAGLADVDAIALVVARQGAEGTLSHTTAAAAVSVALLTNTAVKAAMAWIVGGRSFGADVAKILGASTAAGVVVALVRGLV